MKTLLTILSVLIAFNSNATTNNQPIKGDTIVILSENFKSFNNSTLTLDSKYFVVGGKGVSGVGHNGCHLEPMMTLFPNSRISVNYEQIVKDFPGYTNFKWTIVFKTPLKSRITISDNVIDINDTTIKQFIHTDITIPCAQFSYTISYTEKLGPTNNYIERTVFTTYPFSDPLLIDSAYITAKKIQTTTGLNEAESNENDINVYSYDNNIRIENTANKSLIMDVSDLTGYRIYSEAINESKTISMTLTTGVYVVILYNTDKSFIKTKKLYIK